MIDQRRGVVGRELLEQTDDVGRRSRGQQRGAHVNAELGHHLHGEPGVGGGQRIDGCATLVIVQRTKDFRNVDGMPLLQQIQEVSGRTNP